MSDNLPQNTIDKIYTEVSQIITEARDTVYRTANSEMVKAYWNIGKLIIDEEQRGTVKAEYGKELMIILSKKLTKELGRGFSKSNLFNMRRLYISYPIFQTVSGKLSWSHYCELLTISDNEARSFYEKEALNSNWSLRELKRQVESSLFERLLLSKGSYNKEKVIELSQKGLLIKQPSDMVKDPYVFDFLNLPENKPMLEKDLELKLIRHIEDFLLELGKGFMYVGSQQRITLGNEHYYVDMVFYNKILKAYVLVDLKVRKLKHIDVGQMNTYLNYFKAEVNEDTDNEPIGIILCADKNEIEAQYALGGLNNQIFASKYVYHLPDKELLMREVEKAIKTK
jgi:predicted nuclease of restriction endonuclease-like (RecB) superfamily